MFIEVTGCTGYKSLINTDNIIFINDKGSHRIIIMKLGIENQQVKETYAELKYALTGEK